MAFFLVFIFLNFRHLSKPSLQNLHLLRIDIQEGAADLLTCCSVSTSGRVFIWFLFLLPHFRCCCLHLSLSLSLNDLQWYIIISFPPPPIPARHSQLLDWYFHWDVHHNLKINISNILFLSHSLSLLCLLSPLPSLTSASLPVKVTIILSPFAHVVPFAWMSFPQSHSCPPPDQTSLSNRFSLMPSPFFSTPMKLNLSCRLSVSMA